MNRTLLSPVTATVCFLAAAHAVFAWNSRDRQLDLDIISPPPAPLLREALSFGDHQFLYRVWSLDLQNAGDTGGRATRMQDYDYDYVLGWLMALQDLDPGAQYHVFLATRYFSLTPNLADVRRVVEFIVDDVDKNPERKWFWLTQAIEKADHVLNDTPYALQLANKLAAYDFPGQPTWTWLFPAVLLEKMERYQDARNVIENVRNQKLGRLEKETIQWMEMFERRLLN